MTVGAEVALEDPFPWFLDSEYRVIYFTQPIVDRALGTKPAVSKFAAEFLNDLGRARGYPGELGSLTVRTSDFASHLP